MIGREKRVLLRHYVEQGMTKAAIARHVGVSRDTIYRWIATGQLDRVLDEKAVRYRPRPAVLPKLDPYKAIIDVRLAAGCIWLDVEKGVFPIHKGDCPHTCSGLDPHE